MVLGKERNKRRNKGKIKYLLIEQTFDRRERFFHRKPCDIKKKSQIEKNLKKMNRTYTYCRKMVENSIL